MSLEPRNIETMPSISAKISGSKALLKYVVKRAKFNMDEPADMLELSDIETKALHAKPGDEEVVIVSEDKYTFMDKCFLIVKFLEKTS